ncbi:alanine/glycine:cation symporter family protein [Fibrobacterota bacterium]
MKNHITASIILVFAIISGSFSQESGTIQSSHDSAMISDSLLKSSQSAMGEVFDTAHVESVPEAPVEENADNSAREPEKEPSILAKFNGVALEILFFDMAFGLIKVEKVDEEGLSVMGADGSNIVQTITFPLMVAVLLFGGLFFTFWFRFINIRGFKHSVAVIMGKYDKPDHKGEITHFRALTSALSATVGLGNIAGVAIAIQMGGPGAVFWMVLTAVFGMSAKFSSCTLSQLYRKFNADGTVSGGPMYYLDLGLREKGKGWGILGKVLGLMFAFFVIGGAIGGGNMFQINQTVEAFVSTFKLPHGAVMNLGFAEVSATSFGIGVTVATLVGVVILGGIKRIGAATSRVVPIMVGIYVIASVFIILTNFKEIPNALYLIVRMAFTDNAFYGGVAGVLVWGIKRASFSNEAGLGSAAIAHAAAKTDEPVREGIVAMIGPFIDTIIVCSMTAFVVIISGAWKDPAIPQQAGVALTTYAYGTVITWFPYVLTGCIGLFAYSTMISWCYYGERAWIYLLDHIQEGVGLKTILLYRLVFIFFIVFGAVNTLEDVLLFTDLLILSMAFPNIIGSVILAPKVLEMTRDYWSRYKSGQMATF